MAKLDRQHVEDIVGLTPMQEGILFHYLKDPLSDEYFEQLCLEISGKVNEAHFAEAWESVIQTNEMLRTLFRWENVKAPVQIILKQHPLQLELHSLQDREEDDKRLQLNDIKTKDREKKFDLRKVPFRIALCRLEEEKHEMIISSHHILFDGWSSGLLLKQFMEAYRGFSRSENVVRPNKKRYKDFVKIIQNQDKEQQKRFWQGVFEGFDSQTRLTSEIIKRPEERRDVHHRIRFSKDELERFARQNEVTLASLIYGVWGIVLQKNVNEDDIVFGTTVSGRSAWFQGIEEIVGLFINTIPLRVTRTPDESAIDLIRKVHGSLQSRDEHEHTPLADIKRYSGLDGQAELFDTIVVFENYPLDRTVTSKQGEIAFSSYSAFEMTNYDLTISVTIDDGIEVCFSCNEQVLGSSSVIRLAEHFAAIMKAVIRTPGKRVDQIEIISAEEKKRILYDFNNTRTAFPDHAAVSRLFERQAVRTPDHTAVVCDGRTVTYQELDAMSNSIAHELTGRGVKAGEIVAIMAERSIEMIAGIIAILKAGAAYLPVDPAFPESRKRYMLQDSGARLLLAHQEPLDKSGRLAADFPAERIMLLDDHRLYSGQTFSPVRDPDPDGLFAVFYTSGTTGKPKGVMVENKSVVSHIQWFAGTYGIDSTTNVLQMTNYIFDPSIQEFFGTLLHGATMHIAGQNVILDREQFGDYVDRHQIHIINLIPTLLKQLMSSKRKLNSLRIIISGGERLDDSLKDELVGNGYVLYNNYGPTETTVDALSSLCSAGKVTLGKPIANARCYILDRDRNLAPIGIAGELYIAGAGVARGYLNMPELTAEKFMNDPFMPDERMYRTGDMGRWLPDGEVELIGRADHQVKIRGHRIELGEIQNRLLQHDQIRDAVVIDLDNHESKKTICAYIVANIPLETRHLREFLSAELPDYMVPSSFVRLEKLPLTSIGKIDRRALPAPAAITGNEFAAPRSQTEEVLADIWTTVLGIDKGAVGINDNFFELGGDSILSIQIAGKAMQAGIPITVSQIFQHQTIAELANEAEQLEVRADKAAEAPETGEVPLTPIQMWFFEQNLENVHHWNQAVLLETRPGMNPEWLKQSFQNLVRAHDSFRLRFIKRGGEWIQTYSDARGEGSFQVFDMSGISPWQREEKMKGTCSLLQRSLNITEGPLIRAAYFQFGKEDSGKLFITAHHLVVDGYSWRVITQDLQDGCEQLEKGESVKLLPGSLSFKKWSAYIREYAKSDKIKGEQSYWQNSIPSSVNPIPADLDHGLNTEEAADTISVTLTKEETDSLLHDIHGPFRTRIDDILLAALSCTLRDWSGAALIDLEGHGREKLLEEHDVSRTVGWFTSVYPIVLGDTAGDAESGEMSGSLIKQVKERYRSIPGGGIGYEILYYLAEDGIRETIASKPRAQISFNYLGQFDQVLKKSGLFKLADVNTGSARALKGIRSHLIDIDAMIAGGALTIDWKYGTRIHLPETIRQLAEDFVRHLRSIILICKAEQTRQFTPSDFPLAPVEQNKLDEWAGQYRNVEDIYTLSPVQQSMIFHHVYSPGSSVTVEQTIYSIHTGLNIGAFEKVWQTVLNRHESLRASYHWEGLEEPVQIIHHDINIPFEVLDWTGVPESGRRTRMERLIEEDRRRGFDLSKPPLMRILVVQWEKSAYEVIWTHHHLQLDGWCIGILLSEIGTLYEAYSSGHKPAMKDALPFKEYIEWYRAQNLEQAEHYWKRTLKGFKTPIHFAGLFPAAAKIAAEQTPAFGKAVYEVQPAMQEALRNFSRKHRLTLNTIIQGAWAILLNRYSGEKDIVFGATSSGRPTELAGSASIIGCFMNTLPFRVFADAGYETIPWLQDIQRSSVEMRQFEYTPLSDIRSWSEVPRNSALYDLYESIVIIENYPFDTTLKDGLGSLKVQSMRVEEQMDYPLTVYCNLQPELHFNLLFDYRYLADDTAHRMLGHLINIIQGLLEGEGRTTGEISMLSGDELRQITDGSDAYMNVPKDQSFNELFEAQVKLRPGHTAVICGDERLTYGELDILSNRLAHKLIKWGIGPEVPVGLFVERSINLVVGIMGILKAGGAFLPIDADYPGERVDLMLEDARVPVLLTESSLEAKVRNPEGRTVCLDREWDVLLQEPADKPASGVGPGNLAYVIYTSGSTGRPKGVMMPHEAVVSHSLDLIGRYRLTPEDRVLQFSSIGFDISLEQVLTTLAAGAALVLRDNRMWTPRQFSQKCKEYGLTVTNLPTSYWNEVVQQWHIEPDTVPGGGLRLVIVGGERMLPEKVALWEKLPLTNILLLNAYGPAETAMTSTLYPVSGEGSKSADLTCIPVGKPLANRRIYIVDEDMRLLPVGVKGEIGIGGIPLARGYLNNPELTNEKFIKDPFFDGYGDRLYLTGDLGRRLGDGNIEVLGRKDEQTKIRGHRIDIGEIESILNRCSLVKDAAVVVRSRDTTEHDLAAFYVASDPMTNEPSGIREFLNHLLPAYMIPAYFIPMDRLPLNPNGKIDRKALAGMEIVMNSMAEYEAPANNIQTRLVSIWEKILGTGTVGINHHFFEIGGQSLKAITLISEIHREFEVELPLVHVFEAPTIKQLSVLIEETMDKKAYLSIEPAAEKARYEVSAAQRRLFIVSRLAGASTNYNIPGAVLLSGRIDVPRLEQAFRVLVERHEMLRTSFIEEEGRIYQIVHGHAELEIRHLHADESGLERLLEQFVQPFELEQAPLFRAAIVEVSASKCLLMYDMHHMISDGQSIAILIREFVRLYEGETLPEPRIQYKDFSEWQNQWLVSDRMKKQEDYWLRTFSSEIPLLDLPTDRPRPGTRIFEGGQLEFELDHSLTLELNRIARGQGVTLYAVLLAAYNVLLLKYTGQEDIVVGSPVAGRRHAELENIVGMFVNTLALRNFPDPGKTLEAFVKEVAERSLEALENQEYPFEMLVEKLQPARDLSRHPLFDVMFAFENVDMAKAQVDDFEVIPFEYNSHTAKFDLELKVTEREGGLRFVLEYSTSLFNQETIVRMAGHLVRILEIIAEDRTVPLGEIDLLSAEEKKMLLSDFNRTRMPFPDQKTIKQLFEEQAQKHPHRTVVVSGPRSMTYKELNEKANQLAKRLIGMGARPETVIGILAEPSLEMIIGIWGVVKSGAAYLPIDSEFPGERIRYMLEDSGAIALLVQPHLSAAVDYPGEVMPLDYERLVPGDAANPADYGTSNDPVYIIYTSGTTGIPKGVPVKHRSLVNYSSWFTRTAALEPGDRTMLLSSFAFDLGYTSLYSSLLNGCELHLASKDMYVVPEKLLAYLTAYRISYIKLTPSLFGLMINSPSIGSPSIREKRTLEELRLVVLGGEEIKAADIGRFHHLYPGARVINHYGPTEATIGAIIHTVRFDYLDSYEKKSVIGRPVDNISVLLLDSRLKLVPIGVAGEICISGEGLTEGYLNLYEQNAEKFVEASFGSGTVRLYKTGDLGRLTADGEIEFLGRTDSQLKIRGFRVEPEEVASILRRHDSVIDAVVTARRDENFNHSLYAYLVLKEGADSLELRQYASNRLPYYMVPQRMMKLKQIPLTPNGKIDFKALPEPSDAAVMTVGYEMPADPVERKMAEIWGAILAQDKVGVQDSFFELGGHSLSAMLLAAEIHKAFHVDIPLREIFRSPTIRGMREYMRMAPVNIHSSLEPIKTGDYYELSSAQRRFYALHQIEGIGTSYNMPRATLLEGEIDPVKLEKAFSEIVKRHEAFRTSFDIVDGEPVQRIHIHSEVDIRYTEPGEDWSSDLADGWSDELMHNIDAFIRPFDLSKPPLLRVGVIRLSQDRHLLLTDMHHIISDGYSVGILVQEFAKLYQGEPLPEIRLQYKDYAAWQNRFLGTEAARRQEEYWSDMLSGDLPVLNLPTDFPRPAMQSFEGESIIFETGNALKEQLSTLCLETGTTLYMVLLAAYSTLLSRYASQQDIIVGSPVLGRTHSDLQNIIGMFVNTLAIRSRPRGDRSFAALLAEVKENLLEAYEHQDYQFDMLLDKLKIKRDPGRNPIFSTMLAIQDSPGKEHRIGNIALTPVNYRKSSSKFDLSLFAETGEDRIFFEFEYASKLFVRETVEKMAKDYLTLLNIISRDPEISINAIEIEGIVVDNADIENITFHF